MITTRKSRHRSLQPEPVEMVLGWWTMEGETYWHAFVTHPSTRHWRLALKVQHQNAVGHMALEEHACLSRSICTVRMKRSRPLWTVASLPNLTIQICPSAPRSWVATHTYWTEFKKITWLSDLGCCCPRHYYTAYRSLYSSYLPGKVRGFAHDVFLNEYYTYNN